MALELRDAGTIATACIALAALALSILNYRRTKPKLTCSLLQEPLMDRGMPTEFGLMLLIRNVHGIAVNIEQVGLVLPGRADPIAPQRSSMVNADMKGAYPQVYLLPPMPLAGHASVRLYWDDGKLHGLDISHVEIRLAHGTVYRVGPRSVLDRYRKSRS